MYRTIFNPNLGAWQIQLKGLFLWKTVQRRLEGLAGEKPMAQPLNFNTYDEATAYVNEKGLPKVYRNWHDKPSTQIMQGYQPVRQHMGDAYQ